MAERGASVMDGPWQARVGAEDPPAGDEGQPPPGRRSGRAAASRGGPGRPEAEGGSPFKLEGDLDGEGQLTAQGHAHGQQAGGEGRGLASVAGPDVAHGPGRLWGAIIPSSRKLVLVDQTTEPVTAPDRGW